MKGIMTKNGTLMVGDYLMEEIWWDGTGLTQCGNHTYFLPHGEEVIRIYTDAHDLVTEIEKA